MDDLDHSMHISDHDWLRFFEESEKCCLLHASLACPDSSGLSDADDPDFTTQTCAPTKEHQAGEDSKEPGFVEEEGSIVQCSSDVDGKGGSGPKSEHEPVMKNALDGDSLNPAEKERWFVSVNGKQPAQQLAPATVPVVKKKRKQKKICKVDCTRKDKANTIKNGKLPEHSNTRLETNVNTTYIESSRKSDSLDHLDKENNSESINVKSDSNEDRSYDTMSTQEICRESAHIQLNTGLSCKESTFALQKTSDPNEIKSDTCNESTKYSKTLDSVFIHEKDRDVSSESSQTKLTMDLTCLQDSSIDDSEIKMERTCLIYSSSQEKLHNMVKENTKTGTFNDLDTINQTRSYSSGAIQEECSKIKTWTCFGASCKEDSLDLTLGNTDEPERDSDKPIDNPVTYHTNSIESDDFADYETFSSSSYDSETYHSAVEDPGHLSLQNSPCNLSARDNGDSLTDRRMQFTNGCFKQVDGLSLVKLSQIVPPAKPSADTTPNHNSTCSSGTDSPALCISVDTPTFADNSLDSLGDRPESSPQRDVTMESPEAYAKSTGNSQPVYAISAFWDEMEKLTINDILQIRMGRCMLPIEEAVITDDVETTCTDNASTEIVDSINRPESAFLDTADSDYYSKPDRSSCDFSTSDFEEEYWQFINSSRNASPDQYDKSYQSECMDYLSTGEESDDMGTPVPSEDYSGQAFCNSTVNSYDLAVPLQIRKNKSMYDIHAPKTMEDLSSQAFWDRSNSKSLKEPLKMTDGFEVVTPIMCLVDEQYQISFPEVFEYLFDDNKAKCEAMSVSVYGLQRNYASPMTDYTFCTATNDLPLMPYNEGPIPIFSCSRPTVRELTFPKPGSIFLGTNYMTMKDVSPIQIVSRSILRAMDCKHIDRSYCFTQDLTSLYSIKRICFLDKGSYAWRDQAEDEEKPVDVTDSNVTVVGEGGVLSVTPKIFKEAALWQISMKNQMPADYQSIFSTIKQSDMCLVCIAFASWVLRSSDPEAADAWKAALLANVSALSAIQYLRHYMKKKTSPPDE